MTAPATKYLTLEEYFEFEYNAKIRHEYLDGKLRPMSYTSPNHGRIARNLSRIIDTYLMDKEGEIWTESRMVYVPDCNKIYYPDAVIVLDQPQYFDYKGKMQATLNPTVLIEINSDSTEAADKTDKWECYQTMSSLKQYVLISQKNAFIELYERQAPDSKKWIYTGHSNFSDVIQIAGCEIFVKDIYHKVAFPAPTHEEEL
ncbi:MAG: Uma2 family endonuclease [Saprospiraceae bacterium]